MKRFLAAAAVTVLAIVSSSQGQCSDPFDDVLCVKTLPAGTVLNVTDGVVSTFWNNWTGDYAEMVAPASCYPDRCGFVGTDDASLKVRAGATSQGLFVLIEVMDNTWVDRTAADDIGADATDLFFDRYDSQYLYDCTDCLVGLYGSMLSYTTNQFQVWMGATTPPSGFMFQFYDENLWSWQAVPHTWASAEAQLGFKAEVITVDATHKAQEWFFPWYKFGTVGIPEGTDLSGVRLGFAGGYNDKDGDNPTMHSLRWTLKDPWVAKTEANYWGDLLIGADLVVSVPQPRAVVREAVAGASGPSEYFTIKGERMDAVSIAKLPVGALIVKRTAENGRLSSRMVRVGR